jgi:integrase
MELKKRGKLWYLHARIKPSADQPVQRHRISTGCEDKQDAIREAQKINARLLEGAHSWRRQVPTMNEWWLTFFEQAKGRIADATRKDWEGTKARILLEVFGKMRLSAITSAHCEQYRDTMLKKYKPGTVRSHMLLLMNVLNAAHRAKLIPASPAKGVELPQFDRRRRVVSADEQHALIAKLQEEMQSPSERQRDRAMRLRNFLVIALGTGLRIGTIAQRLGKSNLAKTPDGMFIEIRTKGNKLHRVPALPEVEEAIDSQGALTNHAEWLFDYTPLSLREQLHDLRERANVAHFTPHDLRRTFGTRLALGDARLGVTPVPLSVLKELMGHSAVQITQEFYTVAESDSVKSSFLKRAASGLSLDTAMAPGTVSGTPA